MYHYLNFVYIENMSGKMKVFLFRNNEWWSFDLCLSNTYESTTNYSSINTAWLSENISRIITKASNNTWNINWRNEKGLDIPKNTRLSILTRLGTRTWLSVVYRNDRFSYTFFIWYQSNELRLEFLKFEPVRNDFYGYNGIISLPVLFRLK